MRPFLTGWYFPVMESTSSARRRTKPPTRSKLLVEGRKRAYLSFPVSQRISPLRRRPGGFPIAPWTPSGPIPVCVGETCHKKRLSCERQEKGLPFFSVSQRLSPLRRRPKGFPVALWKPSALCCAWGIPQETDSLWQAGKEPTFLFRITKAFASAEATKGLSGRPLETFGPLLRMGDSTRNRFLVAGTKKACLSPCSPRGPISKT